MNRARARIWAIALGALAVPAFGCTFIVQFEDPGGEADASTIRVLDATTVRDGSGKADAKAPRTDASSVTADAAPPTDAESDEEGGGDDSSDAGDPEIFAKAPAGTVSGPPPNCDPCHATPVRGWQCESSTQSTCPATQQSLVFCAGDAGPTLAYDLCEGDCTVQGGGLVDICNPCSADPPPASACIVTNNDPAHEAYLIFCDVEERPDAAATRVCKSSDCTTGCTAP